jgi:hypothetical protein
LVPRGQFWHLGTALEGHESSRMVKGWSGT